MSLELGSELPRRFSEASHPVAFPFQLESLRASYAELKAQSQEEIRRLWSQLESPRPDRQDASGKELPIEKAMFLVVETPKSDLTSQQA